MRVSENRIIIDELETIKERLENGFKAIYGENLELSSSTPDGQMIGLFGEALSEVNQVLTFITQMLDPYLATGEWLDQRVAYAGLLRKTADYSRANSVTIHGASGTIIKKGTILKDKNSNLWVTDYEVTLGAEGSKAVSITSQETGAFILNEQDELEMQEIILGVDRIVAAQNSILGADEESDGDLLLRFMQSHSINNNDERQGLESYLLNLKGVKQCKVLENYTNQTDANGVEPHSLNAIVLGGDDTAIGEAILRKKIGGCGVQGQTKLEIEFLGAKREVKFDRPTQINPRIFLRIKRTEGITDINTDKIKELLSNHVFNIGEDVYISRLYSIINDVKGFEVTQFKINGGQSLPVAMREICVINKNDIDLAVV
nr:MAG TPA: Baseplate J like protein [Caudoviricetes sp.]DAY39220.1 MAG TPA: Baseplate J like protein [Caudoviricetes sp.]